MLSEFTDVSLESIRNIPFLPPIKRCTCFTTCCLSVGIHLYRADESRALLLATVPGGPVARILRYPCHNLASVSGQGTEILLQAKAI